MVKIFVERPFTLNIQGKHTTFHAGIHEVEQSVADHWYVKAHSQKEQPKAEKAEEKQSKK